MKQTKIILSALAILCTLSATAKSKKAEVIAHRGYWTTEGSYENTISAIKNAMELGVWGAEFDVWITADSVAVIHHDPRTKAGDVIETSGSQKILATVLPNGERIPTLEQYLAAGAKGKIKLILEIKPHSSPEKDKLAVQVATRLVRNMRLHKKVEYISFSRTVCDELVRTDPKAKVAYLEGDMSPAEAKERGYTGIDYSLSVMQKNEAWFGEAHKEGLTVNVWTVNKPEDMQYVIDRGADYITTNYPVEALKLAGHIKE